MKTTLLRNAAVLALVSAAATASMAAAVVVTPTDVSAVPTLNQWYLTNFRGTSNGFTSNTVAEINTTNPRSGNGSVQMSLTNGTGKADYAYTWGFVGGRTLGNLNTLSYDWFRSGTSTALNLQPAMRLYYDADGNANTTADQGYLIYEQVYNGPVLSDVWVSDNIIGDNFWQRQFAPGNTVEKFDVTLAEWTAGEVASAVSDVLSANTAILGIEFGIGSGWNGTFNGHVDNVAFRFGTEDVSSFNFEAAATAVPEPGSLALMGVAILALVGTRRRAQKR